MALASAACGSADGAHADPDLDVDGSDTGALLHHADAEASGSCQLPDGPRTVRQMKGPLGDLQGDCVPAWTQEQLDAGFTEIRDRRMITVPENPGFDRRIPWLAADNGCEERAEAASYHLEKWGYPTPYYARVLVKPNKRLVLRTDNEPGGSVRYENRPPTIRHFRSDRLESSVVLPIYVIGDN